MKHPDYQTAKAIFEASQLPLESLASSASCKYWTGPHAAEYEAHRKKLTVPEDIQKLDILHMMLEVSIPEVTKEILLGNNRPDVLGNDPARRVIDRQDGNIRDDMARLAFVDDYAVAMRRYIEDLTKINDIPDDYPLNEFDMHRLNKSVDHVSQVVFFTSMSTTMHRYGFTFEKMRPNFRKRKFEEIVTYNFIPGTIMTILKQGYYRCK